MRVEIVNSLVLFTKYGDISLLYNLILPDGGKINIDKLYDWLLTSDDIKYDAEVSAKIKKETRKRKIKRINGEIF